MISPAAIGLIAARSSRKLRASGSIDKITWLNIGVPRESSRMNNACRNAGEANYHCVKRWLSLLSVRYRTQLEPDAAGLRLAWPSKKRWLYVSNLKPIGGARLHAGRAPNGSAWGKGLMSELGFVSRNIAPAEAPADPVT